MGHNPILAVETMQNAIIGAEKIYPYNKHDMFALGDATDSINAAAVKLCADVDAWGLICLTSSGASVRKIARYRPRRDIYAVVHSEKVARFLTICWGVVPAFMIPEDSIGQVISKVIKSGLQRGVFHLEKSYILTAGDAVGREGSTNMIRLLKKEEMEFFLTLGVESHLCS